MRYGYARVSTRGQVKGNSLVEQRQQLMDIGCDEVIEEQYTGATTDRPQGRLMLHILLAFAEFERDMIVERTQAGKAIARTKSGFREGRPPIAKARKIAAVSMVLKEGKSYKEASEAVGISKSTIVRAIREYKLGKIILDI